MTDNPNLDFVNPPHVRKDFAETITVSRQELGDMVFALGYCREKLISRGVVRPVGDFAVLVDRLHPLQQRLHELYANPLHFEPEQTD